MRSVNSSRFNLCQGNVKEPFPYDEFATALKGQVILTRFVDQGQTYKTGKYFLVPKGWTGTWDMPEHYREIIVVETKAMSESED